MAASLVSRHPDGRVLGITAGITPDHVVVSVIKDGVHVHSIQDGALVRTYPLGSNNGTLVNPVVADPDNNSYFAALRDVSKSMDYLVTWEASAINVPPLSDISPRIPVDGRIAALHLLQLPDSSSAVVVLANGSVAVPRWNDFTLQFVSTTPAKSTFVHSSASNGTLLVVSRPATGDLVVETFSLTQQGVSKAAVFSMQAPTSSTPAKVLSAVCTSSTVACLWSTGDLKVYRQSSPKRPYRESLSYHIDHSLLPSTSSAAPTTPASASKKRKAPHTSQPDSPHPSIALLSIDNSRLLLAASTTASPSHVAVSTLDTRFGCVLSESLLPLPSPPSTPHTHSLTLTSARDSLILSTAGHVYHLTLDIPRADLSSMLGKLSVLTPSSSSPATHVLSAQDCSQRCVPPSTLLGHAHHTPLSVHHSHSATSQAFRLQPAHLAPHAPGTQAAPAMTSAGVQLLAAPAPENAERAKQQQQMGDQASTILSAMLQQQRADAGAAGPQRHVEQASSSSAATTSPAGQLLDRALSFLAECGATKASITAPLPQLVALQLAEAERWEQLGALLAAHPLQSLNDCSGALEALVGAHQHVLAARLCRSVREVQPGSIATALELLLARGPGDGSAVGAGCKQHRERLRAAAAAAVQAAEDAPLDERKLVAAAWAAAAVDGFTAREVCMHALVAVPLDTMEVVAAARQLHGRQVQQLLQYLSKWLQKYDALGFGSVPAGAALDELLVVPAASQVLGWLTSLLDAHLATLLLQGGGVKGLRGMGEVVKRQLAGAMELTRMRGTTEHMLGGGKLPASVVAHATNYTVEVLDLRVY